MIYKQNIQQGNAIEQDDLDELYIGMNQRQVLFVLGTPSVKDPFNQERWDYVQTFSRRGSDLVQRTVTLMFSDGLLSEIEGLDNPFGASTGDDDGGSAADGAEELSEVASFVKKPGAAASASKSPQDAAVESAKEEVLEGVDPDIDSINERDSEDREYLRDQGVLDQTPDDDLSVPDIDG
ncbi:MAG: outer membrane protein assembly factor BamE [Xanthomonadales bacterium]|nr:outer membrane protein assembly factor BamE [Gammaproteobacteria bacterium]MBT8053190.1 outer membrane protein assembly factor BamE [Gammaproteobacteria bacterium]NND57667.1 outer membrane protein assembly factor BamE [Xanthomonadales bacterium]NNK50229.1 outer membrane protein assembly factor BamE [Xanthomonadales bacterium]